MCDALYALAAQRGALTDPHVLHWCLADGSFRHDKCDSLRTYLPKMASDQHAICPRTRFQLFYL